MSLIFSRISMKESNASEFMLLLNVNWDLLGVDVFWTDRSKKIFKKNSSVITIKLVLDEYSGNCI